MYERGDSREAMAAALGMTVQAIQYRLKEAGVTPSRRTPRWEAAQGWPTWHSGFTARRAPRNGGVRAPW